MSQAGKCSCSRDNEHEQRRTYRQWTVDDDATVSRMAGAGYSDAEIGGHMGRDAKMIGRKRRGLGVDRGIPAALAGAVARLSAQTHRRRGP